ncbi:MAG: acyl-CoA thioesterase [Calditrichaeota bacterium]|nr:acyl-CoA thioesterase [Calditrichota bacterium]
MTAELRVTRKGWPVLLQTRVRYAEIDSMAFAYYGHAAAWFEMARTERIRQLGISYADIENQHGLWLPVLELQVKYHLPARYDDLLGLAARIRCEGSRVLRISYQVQRDDEVLYTGQTVHCFLDAASQRPACIPDWFRERLEAHPD